MKIKRYFKWMICLTVTTLAFTACEDQPDAFENTGGLPEVSYIRLPYTASSDSLIVSGYMGNTICMVGNNLTSIRRLYFNDRKLRLTPVISLATRCSWISLIPYLEWCLTRYIW